MTDLLTKVKAALGLHEIDHMDDDYWAEIGPDMARALIAAEQTAGNPDWVAARIKEFDGNHDKGAGAIGEYVATAFHAAVEGRTDD
jgi:hypothetical protein